MYLFFFGNLISLSGFHLILNDLDGHLDLANSIQGRIIHGTEKQTLKSYENK